MHHQVGVGQAAVDFLDALYRQDVAGGFARELVGAVAGADGDGQCVELGAAHEVGCLLGVGQQLVHGHGGFGAVAVFLVAAHGLQRTQAAQFTLHRDAGGVRHVDHLARDVDVVVVVGDGLAVGHQRAVHHDRAEAQVDGALAYVRALAVVLVHHQRNMRITLDGGRNKVFDEGFAGVFARTRAGLQDHRGADLIGRRHDRLHLLQVVDIEGRNAVAVDGCVIQQLAH